MYQLLLRLDFSKLGASCLDTWSSSLTLDCLFPSLLPLKTLPTVPPFPSISLVSTSLISPTISALDIPSRSVLWFLCFLSFTDCFICSTFCCASATYLSEREYSVTPIRLYPPLLCFVCYFHLQYFSIRESFFVNIKVNPNFIQSQSYIQSYMRHLGCLLLGYVVRVIPNYHFCVNFNSIIYHINSITYWKKRSNWFKRKQIRINKRLVYFLRFLNILYKFVLYLMCI